jgi:hypothetical protein
LDAELKRLVEWDEARAAFIAAKKNRTKDPAGYAKAKARMSKMRTEERKRREAAGVAPVAATIATQAKVN